MNHIHKHHEDENKRMGCKVIELQSVCMVCDVLGDVQPENLNEHEKIEETPSKPFYERATLTAEN